MNNNIEEILLKNGYRVCSNNIVFPYSDYFYQKCIKDEIGKKYSINLVHYPAHHNFLASWMVELTNNEPHLTFQEHRPKLENEMDLIVIENNCEKFWKTFNCEYCEKFSG
ncbi:MAG: hypothetical protein AABY22_07025 [Nanoarchaeota archaeon]